MAINDTSTFDPSRRIRAALGEEFSNNLESEAIARLSAAMASNAIRKPVDENYTEEDEHEMHIRNIASKIVHTNPINKNEEAKDPVGLEGKSETDRVSIRTEAYKKSCDAFTAIIENKSKISTIKRATTGFSPNVSTKSNVLNLVAQSATKYVVNNCMEAALTVNDNGALAACSVIAAGANVFGQYFFSANNEELNNMFDPNVITSAEANIIRSTIRNEKLKYAVQHTAATLIVPAAIKYGINHIAGEAIKNNTTLKVATSFGVLSEIGNVGLKVTRKIIEKKELKKVKEELAKVYDFTNLDPIGGYGTLAKAATIHNINSNLFGHVGGAIVGSLNGYKSVGDLKEDIKGPEIPVQVEEKPVVKVEEKPKVESTPKKVEKPVEEVVASTKKSA